jgi:DNA ligase-1
VAHNLAVLLRDLVDTSRAVADTRRRLTKIELLGDLLRRMGPAEVPLGVSYLSGELPQGSIGVGWASLRDLPGPAAEPQLELLDVHELLSLVRDTTGTGSQALRREQLAALFSKATAPEQDFLVRLLLGDLRQGALEGVMVEAVARASGAPASEVRRAHMLAGDLAAVAAAALAEGPPGLARFRLDVGSPLEPMLAQSAPDVAAALERISPAAFEWKLDGARLQVHRKGREVRAFTRNLADVTERVPEVTSAVASLAADSIALDCETIALTPEGRPKPFQATMSRFGSSLDVSRLTASDPLSLFAFDCLHLDGQDLIDRPNSERFAALAGVLPGDLLVGRTVTGDAGAAEAFFLDTLRRGHEGVVAKALDAPYEAGRRGAGWLKVKRAHTLDLVVLAAEWGHGRRRGWLSNLHLGARDDGAGFVMLGKTFKGMTDEMLAWQTQRLLELETHRAGITVFVRPELVVEVAFDGLQSSPRYPGALALRFARIKGYRLDKTPDEADTIATVREIHEGRI